MNKKTIISITFTIGLILISIYFFILPPKVIKTTPSKGEKNVALNSRLVIEFDKPVKRKEIQHSISPEAYGEWKFENPLIENHLFRTLIFVPAIDLNPSTQYQVKINSISGVLGSGFKNEFSFEFETENVPLEKSSQEKNPIESIEEPKVILLDIPLDWQDYPLSCEAASLKMALGFKGLNVSEDDIMEKIGYDPTPREKDIWGNPYQGYVGDINGEICETGYGVYWQPVAKAASNWREAESFSEWGAEDLAREIREGNPIIFWGTLPKEKLNDCSWFTPEGEYIKAFKETHVRLIVGFIEEDGGPSKIIINDPLSGRLYWSLSYFLTNWKSFNYSGVVIR